VPRNINWRKAGWTVLFLYNFFSGECYAHVNLVAHIEGGIQARVFEKRVLRRIFEPKRYEVREECRSLHNEQLNGLYCSSNIIPVIKSKRMKWAGHVACMGERRGVYRVLVVKPEGNRPLGRLRRRREGNIKMDLQKVGWGRGVWTGLIWLRIGTGSGLL